MSDMDAGFDPEAVIEAMAPLLGLTITAEQRPGVVANLAATARFAAILLAEPLPDTAEPAPVFAA